MGKIRILPDFLCNQIAAGEVIERPAAVVKELVENSIDAGADRINVSIESGGKKLVEVSDNGEGMDREDALLALERHATSKINSPEDLYRIETLGFRGEALASIAAVSRLRMVTRTVEEEVGTEVLVEGGKLREVNYVGCPVGCKITVKDLFFNLPARKKFLKADTTEQNHIIDFIQRIAMAHPGIHFRLNQGSRILVEYPKAADLAGRIGQVLGWEFAKKLIYFSNNRDNYGLQGFISPPDMTFPTWKYLYLFVNGRPVRDLMLQKIIRESFSGYIPADDYPAVITFLEVPADLVDVNIHPTKREVRFREPTRVAELIGEGIRLALAELETSRRSASEKKIPKTLSQNKGNPLSGFVEFRRDLKLAEATPREFEESPTSAFFSRLDYVCQIDDTYLVCRDESGVVIIDVHGAHERILYNKLSRTSLPFPSQGLIRPIAVDLSIEEADLLESRSEVLRLLGYEVDRLEGSTALIRSVPSGLPFCRHDAIVKDLIKALNNSSGRSELIDLFFKTAACHQAWRGHSRLREDEVRWLLSEMDKQSTTLTCPHGRPAWLRLTRHDLDRLFKRT